MTKFPAANLKTPAPTNIITKIDGTQISMFDDPRSPNLILQKGNVKFNSNSNYSTMEDSRNNNIGNNQRTLNGN